MNFKAVAANKFEHDKKRKNVAINNIADLPEVKLGDVDIVTEVFAEGTDKEFKVTGFYNREGTIFYRVPPSVMSMIGSLLEDNDALEYVKVKKSGSSLASKYTVIPLFK